MMDANKGFYALEINVKADAPHKDCVNDLF